MTSRLWMLLSLLHLLLLFPTLSAQPSNFVSIDCGGTQDFTSQEGFQWRTDAPGNFDYARGLAGQAQKEAAGSSPVRPELQTLRYFPAGVSRRRSCYSLPFLGDPGANYILRAGFRYGNYDGLNRLPSFLVSLDNVYWAYVQLRSVDQTVYLETISASVATNNLTLCLIRVDDTLPPLVNSIEVRFTPARRYVDENGDPLINTNLHLVTRVNMGGPFVRYPEDAYDRVWEDYREVFPELKNATVVQTSHSVRTSYDPEGVAGAMVRSEPPEVVMQTAVTDPRQISFSLNPVTEPLRGSNVYTTPSTISTWPLLYFAYFNKTPEEVDVFNFGCTGLFSVIGANVTGLPDPFLSVQYIDRDVVPSSLNYTTCSMVKSDPTMVDAIINAVEFFTSQDKAVVTTSLPDVAAWNSVLQSFNLQSLGFGEPCLPTPWDELGCSPSLNDSVPRITEINLSGKNLTGPIPIALVTSLTALRYLNLSKNKLSGDFPSGFEDLPDLRVLDVSNNQLTGRYPQELADALGRNFSFSGNKDLSSSAHKKSITSTIVAGVVAGAILVLAVILAPYLYFSFLSNSSKNGLFDKDYRNLQARLRKEGVRVQPFSLARVRRATKNFRDKIGEGGFGPVYRGVLEDGQEVAVKVLSGTSKQGKQEFYNEIELLSVVNYKYLVSMLGYCQSWKKQILVYEYMVGGDLTKRLRGDTAANDPLSWNDRAAILVEVAEGLEYLHHGCTPAIVHRDVKSNNILLDGKLRAKVGDFGLSKALEQGTNGSGTHITTVVKGTAGYLDPEYYTTGKLNEKSDVYGYGILMMEVLTGRAPVVPSADPNHIFILDWVLEACKSQTLEQLVDENIKKDEYNPLVFSELVRIALWCVEQNNRERPSMTEVVHELRLLGLGTASDALRGRQDDGGHVLSDVESEGVAEDVTSDWREQVSGDPFSHLVGDHEEFKANS